MRVILIRFRVNQVKRVCPQSTADTLIRGDIGNLGVWGDVWCLVRPLVWLMTYTPSGAVGIPSAEWGESQMMMADGVTDWGGVG